MGPQRAIRKHLDKLGQGFKSDTTISWVWPSVIESLMKNPIRNSLQKGIASSR